MQKRQNICHFINLTDQDNIPLKQPSSQLNCNFIERENYILFLRILYIIKIDLHILVNYLRLQITKRLLNKFLASNSVHPQEKDKLIPSDLPNQFQTINHKYATRYSRNNFKEPKRETNYAKYCILARGAVISNSFLSETEKKNILSQHFFKRKIKEKTLKKRL